MYVLRQHGLKAPASSIGWLICVIIIAAILPASSFTAAQSSTPYTIHTNLKSVAHVSGAQLDEFIRSRRPSSPLIGLGQTWVETGRRYNINAYYLMAHAVHESGWGSTRLARRKNNIYGWHAFNSCPYSCASTYRTKAECIRKVIPAIDDMYLNPDGPFYTTYGPTLRGVNVHYATDKHWKYVIVAVMNEAVDFVHST